jgi:hypothetical protein
MGIGAEFSRTRSCAAWDSKSDSSRRRPPPLPILFDGTDEFAGAKRTRRFAEARSLRRQIE